MNDVVRVRNNIVLYIVDYLFEYINLVAKINYFEKKKIWNEEKYFEWYSITEICQANYSWLAGIYNGFPSTLIFVIISTKKGCGSHGNS